ncbi:MAG TPA: hypothetical protein PKW95_13395 [bacterium]|nr:hypothetical protein [bacterium]
MPKTDNDKLLNFLFGASDPDCFTDEEVRTQLLTYGINDTQYIKSVMKNLEPHLSAARRTRLDKAYEARISQVSSPIKDEIATFVQSLSIDSIRKHLIKLQSESTGKLAFSFRELNELTEQDIRSLYIDILVSQKIENRN